MLLKLILYYEAISVLTLGGTSNAWNCTARGWKERVSFLAFQILCPDGSPLVEKDVNVRIGENVFGTSTSLTARTGKGGIIRLEKEKCFHKDTFGILNGRTPKELRVFVDWKDGARFFRGGLSLHIQKNGSFERKALKLSKVPLLVEGKVFDSKTRAPVSEAKVVLFSWPTSSPGHCLRTVARELDDLYYPVSYSSRSGKFKLYGERPRGFFLCYVHKEGYVADWFLVRGDKPIEVPLKPDCDADRFKVIGKIRGGVRLQFGEKRAAGDGSLKYRMLLGTKGKKFFIWARSFYEIHGNGIHIGLEGGCGGRSLSFCAPFLRMDAWDVFYWTRDGVEKFSWGDITAPAAFQPIYGWIEDKGKRKRSNWRIAYEIIVKFEKPGRIKNFQKFSLGPWLWVGMASK